MDILALKARVHVELYTARVVPLTAMPLECAESS